jgi:hypothetical protein
MAEGGDNMGNSTSFLTALLAADFPKVAGVFGLAFLALGIINNKLVLGPVIIPRRDAVGRFTSLVLGFLFATIPFIQLYFGTSVAVYNPPAKNSITLETKVNESFQLAFGSAYAAERSYKITAGQRSVIDASEIFRGKKIAVYVGDVHLRRPITILFFNASSSGAATIKAGANLDEAAIRNTLSPADIVFLAAMTQGQRQSFTLDRQQFTVSLESVIWSLLGEDSVTLTVRTQIP